MNEKKLFSYFTFTVYLTDGSVMETDPVSFKEFKKDFFLNVEGSFVNSIQNESGYLKYLNDIIYLCDNVEESDYFSFVSNNKAITLKPHDIISIKFNLTK